MQEHAKACKSMQQNSSIKENFKKFKYKNKYTELYKSSRKVLGKYQENTENNQKSTCTFPL